MGPGTGGGWGPAGVPGGGWGGAGLESWVGIGLGSHLADGEGLEGVGGAGGRSMGRGWGGAVSRRCRVERAAAWRFRAQVGGRGVKTSDELGGGVGDSAGAGGSGENGVRAWMGRGWAGGGTRMGRGPGWGPAPVAGCGKGPLPRQGPPALPPCSGRAVNKRRDVTRAADLRLNPEL